MFHRVRLALFALLLSCQVTFDPGDQTIACATDSDCPRDFTCQAELLVCLRRGSIIPHQAVTLTVPRSGEINVSTTATFVIAFALPVDAAAAVSHLALTDAAGASVALTVTAAPEMNTLLASATQELDSRTAYTLAISAGIAASGGVALPSEEATTITLTTAERRDQVAPGPVAAILVDRTSLARADISWTNPADADLAGVLILRKKAAALLLDPGDPNNELPKSGVSYAVGTPVGAAEVAAVVRGDHVSIVDLDDAAYAFALFAMDTSTNYAPAARVPFVQSETLSWCPTQSGVFSLQSPDAGQQSLLLQGPSGAVLTAESPLGSPFPIDDSLVSLGATYSARSAAVGLDGQMRGPPVAFVASRANLTQLSPPGAVALGSVAVFGFTPYAWPGVEAEIDSDPQAGSEVWQSVAVTGSQVSARMFSAGTFKIRVRPVVANCAVAAWVDSGEFLVGGGVRYVSVTGSDTPLPPDNLPRGGSRALPYASIERAVADADGTHDMDVYIAEGDYNPVPPLPPYNGNVHRGAALGLALRSHVRLYGGYASDFLTRDPAPLGPSPGFALTPRLHATVVHGQLFSSDWEANGWNTPCLAAVVVPSYVVAVTLDGLKIQPPPNPTALNPNDCRSRCGLYVASSAGVTVTNSHVLSAPVHDGNSSCHVVLTQGGPFGRDQIYDGNLFESTCDRDSYDQATAFWAVTGTASASFLLNHNRFFAPKGLAVDAAYQVNVTPKVAHFTVTDNRFEGDLSAEATITGDVYFGFDCRGGSEITFRNNFVQPGRKLGTDPSGRPGVGVRNGGGCFGVMEGNLIDGGLGLGATTAIELTGVMPVNESLSIRNNIFSAGQGVYNRTSLRFIGSALPSADLVVAHNLLFASSFGVSLTNYATTVFAFGGGNHSGRFVNNVVYGDWQNQAQLEPQGGVRLDAFQNNLIITPTGNTTLRTYSENGTAQFSVAEFEASMCSASNYDMPQDRTTQNIESHVAPTGLFVDPALHTDASLDQLLARDWHIKPGAEASFRFGIDTRQNLCGGDGGNPTACTSPASNFCGNITLDRDGKARPTAPGLLDPLPSPPAVGPYEP